VPRLVRAALPIPLAAVAISAQGLLAPATPAAPPAAAKPKPPFTVKHSKKYRKHPHFVVLYKGSGTWKTVYHSNPPNQGGNPDTNDAHDSSTQAWKLTFDGKVTVKPCGRPKGGGADPCKGLKGPSAATGATTAIGQVDHKHVDGLFTSQNRSVSCKLSARTTPKQQQPASIGITYSPAKRTIAVTAYDPVSYVLSVLPSQCPQQGDAIDGLYDNYFMPGFSFSTGYGPDRWFTSAKVTIPANVFHHATEITIPFAATAAGTPPKGCAVQNPSYERCSTGGSWTGVLTFKLS
jgi:hypothetical protein